MHQTLWYLLAGTRGGPMRARILTEIRKQPANANQLAKRINVDYKTIQHHLELLQKHQLLTMHGQYGAVYLLTPGMDADWKEFEEIWERIGKNTGKSS